VADRIAAMRSGWASICTSRCSITAASRNAELADALERFAADRDSTRTRDPKHYVRDAAPSALPNGSGTPSLVALGLPAAVHEPEVLLDEPPALPALGVRTTSWW
jgi:hypothetical protein